MPFTQSNLPKIYYTDATNYADATAVLDNTGAIIAPATSGNQATANTALSAIQTSVGNIPASPSTAALQTTGNTSLATIATNTGGLALESGGNLATLAGAVSSSKIQANLSQIVGVSAATGHGPASTSLRVELPTDGTGVVGLNASTNTIGAITMGGNVVAASSFNRPADTLIYASGDLIDVNTSASTVTNSPHTIAVARGTDIASVITRVQLKKSGTSLTNAIFRVHFYNAATTGSNGDNGAWLTTSANYIGYFDVTMSQAFTDGAIGNGVPGIGSMLTFKPASGTSNLYYVIEARAAYTPVSGETFTLSAEIN